MSRSGASALDDGLSPAGLSREVTYSAQLPTASVERRVSGYGVSASVAVQIGEDRLLAQWNQGEGVGRYFNDGLSGVGAVYDAGGRLEPLRLSGAYLYYERAWAERWSSTAGFSTLRAESEGRSGNHLRRAKTSPSASIYSEQHQTLYISRCRGNV